MYADAAPTIAFELPPYTSEEGVNNAVTTDTLTRPVLGADEVESRELLKVG
jgi:hypothetical protein